MDGGGAGELAGVALVAVSVLVGRKYGAKAGKKFSRTVTLVVLAWLAVALVLALIWWAMASAG